MKKSILSLATVIAAATLPGAAYAQLAFNAGAVTDYRYRGISQTRLKPAIQGGVDYAAGPFYIGVWASSIKWIKDAGGDAPAEIDVYAGYKGELVKDSLSYDVGVLTYQYPGHKLAVSPVTTEIYGALTFGPATVKYSHSADQHCSATVDSKNSSYIEAAASFDARRRRDDRRRMSATRSIQRPEQRASRQLLGHVADLQRRTSRAWWSAPAWRSYANVKKIVDVPTFYSSAVQRQEPGQGQCSCWVVKYNF